MSSLAKGALWEFVNRTTDTVTEYEIVSEPNLSEGTGTPVRLENRATGGIAQVWATSLLRPLAPASHWRPAS